MFVDSVVVSVSLRLKDCRTGRVIWYCEQFRTVHRQFQLDPFNAIINLVSHEKTARADRIAWLVQEMLRTLPPGPVEIVYDELLSWAVEVLVSRQAPPKAAAASAGDEMVSVVFFEAGQYDLDPSAERLLAGLLPFIDTPAGGELRILGYADPAEPQDAQLALRRAQACREWIEAHAIDGALRIRAESGANLGSPAGTAAGDDRPASRATLTFRGAPRLGSMQ